MARLGRGFPQNRFIPRRTVFPSISLSANTLHGVDHINTAILQSTPTANALHAVDHIDTALVLSTPIANVLHAVDHINTALVHVSPLAGTLHIVDHIVAIAAVGDVSIATTPIVVVLNPSNSDIYNPTFNVVVNATPSLLAALLDLNGPLPVPNFNGATVTFSLYELGGDLVFTRAAVLDDASTGKVHYQTQAGDSATAGTFLGKFHVTYASSVTQDFPDDRYVNVLVDA